MINIELPEKYIRLLGRKKMMELWLLFEQETRDGLEVSAPRWMSENDENRLRNFFHARRSGALSYGMTSFAGLCADWEERFTSGCVPENLEKDLPQIIAVFNEEAAAVTDYLGGKEHD